MLTRANMSINKYRSPATRPIFLIEFILFVSFYVAWLNLRSDMRDSGSPWLGCGEWRSPRCRCGASRAGPCGSCDDEKEDHFDDAGVDVVDPGFADERQHGKRRAADNLLIRG